MTILPRHKDVAKSRLKMSNPWHLLAVGFGSGLSPIVPGTMGSLAAIPFWYLHSKFTTSDFLNSPNLN